MFKGYVRSQAQIEGKSPGQRHMLFNREILPRQSQPKSDKMGSGWDFGGMDDETLVTGGCRVERQRNLE